MRRRILVVSPWAPRRSPQHGGAHVVRGLVGALAERHDVALLHLDDAPVDPEVAARLAACEAMPPPRRSRLRRHVDDAAALVLGRSSWAAELRVGHVRRAVEALARRFEPEVVQVEYSVLGDALGGAPPGALRVLTVHEPAASRRETLHLEAQGPDWLHRLDAAAAVKEERRALRTADVAVAFSERDAARLREQGGVVETVPLGWSVPAEPLDPVGASRPGVLFAGNFVHPPNIAAALTLARDVLPLLGADAHLTIVGPSPPGEVRALAGDRVEVTGEVADVTPYLDRAAVVAAPLEHGGGSRVKVIEALAAGKAVVASSRALEGLSAVPGEHLLVADGPAATARAIESLLADADRRRRLASAARAWALRELSWARMAERYEAVYARAAR